MSNCRHLVNASRRLAREMKMTDDRDVKFETLEQMALLNEIIELVTEFEMKLIGDLDVD